MTFTLVGYKDEHRCNKIKVVSNMTGVALNYRAASESDAAGNPLGLLPYLETADGTIAGHNAAARCLASMGPQANLLGRGFQERAQVEQWVDWSGFELEPWRDVWVYPVIGVSNFPREAGAYKEAKADVTKKLQMLNTVLASRTFLVGDRITLADVAVCSALFDCFANVFDKKFRSSITHVHRYFNTVANQPAFKSVFGEPQFCDKEKMPAGGNKGGAQKANKKAAKKQAPAKKPEPKKVEKKKMTLKDLPKSKVILDDVKRLFSNNSFADASKKFLADFDANGYCLYVSNYNYNAENTVDFMTSNLCTGFLQRLDPARKWGMGVLNISGTGPFDVTGAWIFRGAGVPPPVEDSADAEYHTWTKVDVADKAGMAKWNEYFSSETIDGKPLEERKWFK